MTEEQNKREPGYYWVRFLASDPWQVAKWAQSCAFGCRNRGLIFAWSQAGLDMYFDEDPAIVGPKLLEPEQAEEEKLQAFWNSDNAEE